MKRPTRILQFEHLTPRRMLSVNAELFADINIGAESSLLDSGDWVELNGFIYFQADDGTHGTELWRTDGTVDGTEMLLDINESLPEDPFSQAFSESSWPTDLTVYKNEVYFAATNEDGDELWKTDGTTEGTVRVKDIWEGEESSFPQFLTVYNDLLYFSAGTEFEGDELWNTDGTEEGTMLVADINPGEEGSFPAHLYVFNDELIFSAVTDSDGPELWKSDGTEEGTDLVKDIHEEPGVGSFPESFFEFNDALYFIAADAITSAGTLSSHLFVTDGTQDGTQRVANERLTLNFADRPNVTEFKGHLYFGGIDSLNEFELFRTDGTPGHSEQVFNLSGAFSSSPGELTVLDDQLYFAANDETGRQVWRTNGELAAENVSERLTNVDRDNAGVFPTEFFLFNDELIFNGHDGNTFQVWRISGTESEVITSFVENDTSDFISAFFEWNGLVYFRGSGEDGLELWTLTPVEPADPELLAGDVDGNGKVEFADFLIVSANFGQDVDERDEGDLDGNGKVEFADFLLLSNDFGKQAAALFATDWDATA